MDLEEEIENVSIVDLGIIVRNQQRFSMPGMMFIGRMFIPPAGVSNLSIDHTRKRPNEIFKSPETSPSHYRLLQHTIYY
jgi:hypothetical protein